MSAPIFSGMAGFADNFTRAYSGERRRMSDEEERKAEREWRNEQRGRQRQEWQKADELETALKDAGAVRTEQQGTLTQGQTGGVMQRMFNQNPEEAQRVKGMMDAEAEMTGAAPAMAEPGTAITGKMSRGHQIGQTMGAMGADPNSTEAVAQRTAQAYRQNGQMDKAITMENAIMDQQAKRLGLSIDQLKFADMKTNRALENALKSAPTWYEGAAKFVTDLQRGGLKEMKAEHQLSPDGKSVTLFAVMPDGTKQATGTYPADESGMLQFIQKFATLPIEKRMDVMADTLKSEKEDSRWERTFEFNKKKDENDQQYRNRVLGFQARQDARAEATHKLAMDDAKIPPAVKLQASSYQDQIKGVSAALNKAMAEGSFNPENKGTKDLMAEQAALRAEYNKLLAPYTPQSGTGGALQSDPFGFNNPAPSQTNAAAAPGVKQAAPAQAGALTQNNQQPAPVTPPPSMADIQAHFRENRARLIQKSELEKQAERDPEVQSLRQQHAQAIRAGKAMQANAIMAQIEQVKAQRFGAK
jgi:hypothetical protein